ncbi:MAG: hypothetical protein ACI4KR_09270 [Ruminiclostridium sp.]
MKERRAKKIMNVNITPSMILYSRQKHNKFREPKTKPVKSSKTHIGIELPITDKSGKHLFTGDTVRYGQYCGILLYNSVFGEYGIFFGMWYGEDKYNPDSYGKFIKVPMDNGARMELEKSNDIGAGGDE